MSIHIHYKVRKFGLKIISNYTVIKKRALLVLLNSNSYFFSHKKIIKLKFFIQVRIKKEEKKMGKIKEKAEEKKPIRAAKKIG